MAASCACEMEIDEDRPITPTTKKKVAKHVPMVGFAVHFKTKPKCKGKDKGTDCRIEVTYQWTLTPTDSTKQFILMNADQPECAVTGDGEFDLKVEVTLTCLEALDAEPEGDDDVGVGIIMESSTKKDEGHKKFRIHV